MQYQTNVIEYSGSIKNSLGEPLMGAEIYAEGKNGKVGVISDFDGNFRWNPEQELKSNITIKYLGYKSKTLDPRQVRDKEIILEDGIEQLDAVVITNKKPKSEKKMKKIKLIGIISAGAGLLALGIILVKYNK
jgi:hypothetical protein